MRRFLSLEDPNASLYLIAGLIALLIVVGLTLLVKDQDNLSEADYKWASRTSNCLVEEGYAQTAPSLAIFKELVKQREAEGRGSFPEDCGFKKK